MSRPLYFTLDDVTAKVPEATVTEALDDDRDGLLDDSAWLAVAGAACNEVDSSLGQRYATPFPATPNTPPLVKHAALLFFWESLYLRRGFGSKDTNPFLAQADAMRGKLDQIADGRAPLTPTAEKPRQSVTAVTEPARTSSAAGNLSI
jgi:hypothetical protein